MMNYVSGWCKSNTRLDGYTAIVTGSNTGIGKETALDFYLRGARVIMACRDIKKAELARSELFEQTKELNSRKGNLVIEELDLASLKSVRTFVSRVLGIEQKLQILVNNAGVMMCPQGETEDGFETHMGTNHLGHALLTLLLLPILIQSAPSRIIFVSSMIHCSFSVEFDDMNYKKTSYNALIGYCKSKAANVLFARALARKLEENNIKDVTTYSLHPGVISSGIGRHFSETAWNGATWMFNNIMSWFAKTPRCGAQTTIYCALDEGCAHESGLYYSECAETPASKHCRDDVAAAKLWDVTIEMLKLQNYDPFAKPPYDR